MRYRLLIPILVAIIPSGATAQLKDEEIARELMSVVRDRLAPSAKRVEAVRTIGSFGAKSELVVPDLLIQLQKLNGEETASIQEEIVKTLAQIGYPARSAIPSLTKAIGRDSDLDYLIRKTIEVLVSTSDSGDVSAMVKLLKSKDESLRLRAAKALGKLGPSARPAIAELTGALSDSDGDVRRTALASLIAIQGSVKATDALLVHTPDLADTDPTIRYRAAKAISKLGKEAASAQQALQPLTTDSDADVRRAAQEAIAKIAQ